MEWIKQEDADIYCFQELKASLPDIDTAAFEAWAIMLIGIRPRKKRYSGVGVIAKVKPNEVQYGCGLEQADYEGRVCNCD
ncbi:DNA-(apurinic or apyrimidinic site) lyase [Filimonas sp.]|nr:DNA-(apurinic or apyrimidinic site) lyase [Filimonas sp.]